MSYRWVTRPILYTWLLTVACLPSQANQARYYGAELCQYDQFECITVQRGDTWAKLFPNLRDRELIKRFNRTNVALRYRSWIVVPKNIAQLSHLDLSPFAQQVTPTGKKHIVVRLSYQAFAAYDANGQLVHWGPISGGKGFCADTNEVCNTALGKHRIVRKQGAECESSKYPIETNGGAPMPYCMHYYRGYALHGSTLPGYHASHGCVRLFNDDAQWLNQHFAQLGTAVTVHP